MTTSRALIDAADAQWQAALATAVMPPEDAPRCTKLEFFRERLQSNYQTWRGWDVAGESANVVQTPYPVTVAAVGAGLPEHSAVGYHRLSQLAQVERDLEATAPLSGFRTLLRMATVPEFRSTEIYFAPAASKAAREGPYREASFEGGFQAGTAWMYDHEAAKIVCAGEVVVGSSEVVELGYTSLDGDLFVNLVRELPYRLRAMP